jgi:hypothetical protein
MDWVMILVFDKMKLHDLGIGTKDLPDQNVSSVDEKVLNEPRTYANVMSIIGKTYMCCSKYITNIT